MAVVISLCDFWAMICWMQSLGGNRKKGSRGLSNVGEMGPNDWEKSD